MDLLKAMQTFRTVVEQQSFSAAARELNVVTSAVSRQVNDLEVHFGCKLLQRTTRSMTLTEEGREYLTGFSEILDRLSSLQEDMSERQQVVAGQLRITSPSHSAAFGLQPLLSTFMQRYPQVKLSWLIVNRFVNLVEEGIDLAVRVGELPDSGMVARQIGCMQIYCVAHPEYLARHGIPETPFQLADHQCILDSSNRQPGRWRFQMGNASRYVSVPSSLDTSDGQLAADFAADGLGIALLPDFMLCEHLRAGRLVRILQNYELPPAKVSVVYPANRVMKASQRALIDHLVEAGLPDNRSSAQD